MTESKFSAASLTLLEAGFSAFSSFVTGVLEAFCWDFEPIRKRQLTSLFIINFISKFLPQYKKNSPLMSITTYLILNLNFYLLFKMTLRRCQIQMRGTEKGERTEGCSAEKSQISCCKDSIGNSTISHYSYQLKNTIKYSCKLQGKKIQESYHK